MTKLGPSLLIVLALLSLAYLWRQEGIRDAVRDAKLAERKATLDSLSSVTDTLFADSLKRLQTRIHVVEGEAEHAKRMAGRLKSRLDSLPPPAPTDTLAVLRQEAADSVISYQDSVIFEQDQQIIFWRAVAAAKDSTNLRLREERDRYRGLAESWERQARPGLAARVVRGVPYLLAGAALWEAVR